MAPLATQYTRGWTLLRLLPCLAAAACSAGAAHTQPPWPGKAALKAFDFRPVASDPAFQMFDDIFFAYGIGASCHFDFSEDDRLAGVPGQDVERGARRVGDKAFDLLLAEVEKRHPGNPGNRQAAWWLLGTRSEADGERGRDAVMESGCKAMRPAARNIVLKVLRLPP